MSKRILVESSLTERIQNRNHKAKPSISSFTGINYFDTDTNAYSYEKHSDESNINTEHNNENFFSFIEEINNERTLDIGLTLTHKTVEKEIILANGAEKHQRIYYNEIDMIINTKQRTNNKYHACFGFTNQTISKNQMYEQYYTLIKQIDDTDSYYDFPDAPYEIILNPEVAGVFIHEIIGHMCECDNHYDVKQFINNSIIDGFTIIDDPAYPNLWGSYDFDDEGVHGQKTILLENGKFINFLHSESTAQAMNTTSNGHARSIDYKFKPIVRMSNTFLLTGNISFNEMVDSIPHGIVALTTSGGMLKRNIFKLNVLNGIMIERGKLTKKTGPFCIWGKVNDVLQKIRGIGDVPYTCSGQGCYKLEQGPLPVSITSPHIMIKSALITKK
jgi:predicted Zn-dependent protease